MNTTHFQHPKSSTNPTVPLGSFRKNRMERISKKMPDQEKIEYAKSFLFNFIELNDECFQKVSIKSMESFVHYYKNRLFSVKVHVINILAVL